MVTIRTARAGEGQLLEALQRRSSDVWEAYRAQLAAHPGAIELPQEYVDSGWVRVAVDGNGGLLGFSVVIPTSQRVHELEGLFVEPEQMSRGIGRLLVEDAVARAGAQGAEALEVIAGPAREFYERVGFNFIGAAQTRFGEAVRMRRELGR